MTNKQFTDQTSEFERAQRKANEEGTYVLRLYVTGVTPRSTRAVLNIKSICDEHLRGRYRLEVIDIYKQPVLAKGEQILAAPTLVRHLPLPLRRFIGDMSQKDKILLGLDLKQESDKDHEDNEHRHTPSSQKKRF